MIAGCSSGIDPVFAYAYTRNVMDNTQMPEVNPVLVDILKERGLYSEALMRRLAQEGTLAHMAEIPPDIRRVFVAAHDVSPLYHVRMQAAFQCHTDNAVSKTVNFAHDATQEDVAEVYRLAYRRLQGRHHLPTAAAPARCSIWANRTKQTKNPPKSYRGPGR